MTLRHVSAFSLLLAGAALCPIQSPAQSITTARSGTLHYLEGDVSIDGQPVQQQRSIFPQIHENSVLRTGLGRAEVLLTPGVFLRVGENSSIRMIDERLIATRVEILDGQFMVESDDPQMSLKDSPVTFIYRDYEIRPIKHGLFELVTDKDQLKVYKGEAEVTSPTAKVNVHENRELTFNAALATEKFTDKQGDDLYVWTRDRSEGLAAANVASAQSLESGVGYAYPAYGLYGASPWAGGWFMNPYYGMYTYVPAFGLGWNPFGYGFFSPGAVGYYVPSGGGGAAGLAPVAVRGNAMVGTSIGSPIQRGLVTRSAGSGSTLIGSSRSSSGLSGGLARGGGFSGGGAGGGGVRGGFSGGGAGGGMRGGSAGGGHAGGGRR